MSLWFQSSYFRYQYFTVIIIVIISLSLSLSLSLSCLSLSIYLSIFSTPFRLCLSVCLFPSIFFTFPKCSKKNNLFSLDFLFLFQSKVSLGLFFGLLEELKVYWLYPSQIRTVGSISSLLFLATHDLDS